jgi:peptidoglycan biosynthesis protein MviN/MurJ (putative lipid II flippase)
MDTRTPLIGIAVTFTTYTVLAYTVSQRIGVYGFPLASSAATMLSAGVMSALLHRSFGALGWTTLKSFLLKMLGAMAFMACAFALGLQIGSLIPSDTLIERWFRFAIPTSMGSVAFLAGSCYFGILKWEHLRAIMKGRARPGILVRESEAIP